MTRNCSFGMTWYWCINIFVEIFGSLSLFIIVIKEMLSYKTIMNNGPLKGNVSNFPSCFINNSLPYLLSSPHPKVFYFGFGIEKFFDIWKYIDWYCWSVDLWTCWCWFVTFWWWKLLPKFLLEMVSIVV